MNGDLRSLRGTEGKDGRDRPIARGTAAQRPAANMTTPHSFYYATDTGQLSYSNGTAWTTAGSQPIGAKVRRDAAGLQSIANATNVAVIFDAEDHDSNNFWTSGSPTRLTLSVAGLYRFWTHIFFAANATGFRSVAVILNGAFYVAYNQMLPTVADGNGPHIIANGYHPCAAGDYVEVWVHQTSGAALNISAGAANFYMGFAAELVRSA